MKLKSINIIMLFSFVLLFISCGDKNNSADSITYWSSNNNYEIQFADYITGKWNSENSTKINGVSVTDNDYVTTSTTGETEEITWAKTNGWPVPSGQSLVIVFQSQVGENALTGENQNEVVVTPQEVPADPTTLRTEAIIEVAQSCDTEEPQAEDEQEQTVTPPTEQETTTPDTGLFDSIIIKAIIGIVTIFIGWFIYSKPQGQLLVEKLVESGAYKEAEVASWKIFNPKKYFEEKTIRKLKKKD